MIFQRCLVREGRDARQNPSSQRKTGFGFFFFFFFTAREESRCFPSGSRAGRAYACLVGTNVYSWPQIVWRPHYYV